MAAAYAVTLIHAITFIIEPRYATALHYLRASELLERCCALQASRC